MRTSLSILVTATLLAACGGPSLTPEQQAERAKNTAQNEAALSEAKTVSVNGKNFRVAHVKERNQALVDHVGKPAPYYVADIEAASRAATGCNGTFNPGVLAFIGGDIATTDLTELRSKISGSFPGWSVALKC
ncbi:hypothetical protein [Shimia sp. MIT1388]|uniref:hypothetical protein n=1 Tax=Shimia sp. MIT1388 TaxID=3096992 RepID=UPI00399BDE31